MVNTIPVSGSQTSQAVKVDTSTTDYTFDVRAQNKAGGRPQPAVRPAPRCHRSGGTDGRRRHGGQQHGGRDVAGRFRQRRERERDPVSVLRENGGGWRGDWVGGGTNGAGTIGNGQVNNNGTYTIRVRAVSTVDGSTYASGASNDSNAVSPYGPIGNPSANASASGTNITYSWSSPSRNGRDIATEVYIDGGLVSRDASGSITRGYGYSETHSIEVRTSAAGQTTTASSSARTVDAPPPAATGVGHARQLRTRGLHQRLLPLRRQLAEPRHRDEGRAVLPRRRPRGLV